MVVLVSVVVVSCSKDEKENVPTQGSSIIGTWRHEFSSGYIMMFFSSNNTGYYQEYDEEDGGLRRKHNFTYIYSESQQRLVLIEDDGDTDEYIVVYINSKEMEIIDLDGKSETYTRIN